MFSKHFFKTVSLFTVMILLGLLGVFLVSNYIGDEVEIDSDINLAK